MAAVANYRYVYSDHRYWESLGWRNVPRHPAPPLRYSHIDVVGTLKAGKIIPGNQTFIVGLVNEYRLGLNGKGQGTVNQAVDKLRSKLRPESGEWLSLIATYNESATMIHKRTLGMIQDALNFFSRNPRKTAKALKSLKKGLPRSKHDQLPSAKTLAKASADKASKWWLEWWWGWSPLIQDLHAHLGVMAWEPPSGLLVRGVATHPVYKREYSKGYVNTPEGWRPNISETVMQCKFSVAAQCRVRVTNINIFLAESLGLLNPLATAWEVTPYSWLVNWFVNVDSWLNNWSWDFGLAISEPLHTRFMRGTGNCLRVGPSYTPKSNETSYDIASVERVLSLPSVQLRWSPPDQLAVTRAASAVSLLTQFLLNPRKTA